MAGRKMKTRQGLIAFLLPAIVLILGLAWTEPGYARILRAGVMSIQKLISGHIVKTRNPGRQKNEDQARVDRVFAARHCSASWDWPGQSLGTHASCVRA
jgi:hypothetical protein